VADDTGDDNLVRIRRLLDVAKGVGLAERRDLTPNLPGNITEVFVLDLASEIR